MTDNKLPRTETESLLDIALDDLGGVEVLQGLDFSQLSDTQRTAVDLHKRGLNVFPIPRGHKEPYILRPLFYGRLHRCGHSCKIRHAPNLESLFDMQNIAVMMGRTSENLFAIDCDTQADFRGMAAELDRRGLPYWAYTSRRGGSYLMRLAEGEAKNKTLKGWEHVEIWGSMHYVILPPSIHPSGELYRWKTSDPYRLPIDEKPPLVSIQALDWLEVERATTGAKWEDTELLGLPAWTSTLSRNNRKILAQAIDGGLAEGVRNTTLRNPTYDIAAMIDAGLIDYATGLDLLEEAAAGCEYPIKSIRGML